MFFKLFLLFTIVPILELYFLIKIGGLIGAFNTVIVIVITATLGAYLARSQGFDVITKIQKSLSEGRIPGYDIMQGLFILIGAFTLLTPGFITDIIGFSMLVPPIRAIYIRSLGLYFNKKIKSGQVSFHRNTDDFNDYL
jgi:UPF0716 protein FxsA